MKSKFNLTHSTAPKPHPSEGVRSELTLSKATLFRAGLVEGLTYEDKIILACSTQALDDKVKRDVINIIDNKKLNWEYLLKKAELNKVSSILYKNLQSMQNDLLLIPSRVWEPLKNSYLNSTLKNMQLLADLTIVLKAFNGAGIKAMVIKGASLIERVYKDIAFRCMLDIDIIVKEEDFSAVKDILKHLGYNTEYEYFDPLEWSVVPLDYHINFLNKNGTNIEVKFCLWGLDFPHFENQNLCKEAKLAKIARQEALIPFPEYSLLIMCAGLVRHAFTGLIWYCDIKEIINYYKDKLNWQKLITLAREKRIDVLVYYGLFFARHLINADVPEVVIESLRPNYFRRRMFELLWNKEAILNLQDKYSYRDSDSLYIPYEAEMVIFSGKLDFRLNRLAKLLNYIPRAISAPKCSLAKHSPATASPIRGLFYGGLRISIYLWKVLKGIFLLFLRRCGF